MAVIQVDRGPAKMASRWRRRRMCVLVTDLPAPAALRDLSACGAFVETNARPQIGDTVELRHPEAGTIEARVTGVHGDGVALVFDCGERSVGFVLAAVAADMTRP